MATFLSTPKFFFLKKLINLKFQKIIPFLQKILYYYYYYIVLLLAAIFFVNNGQIIFHQENLYLMAPPQRNYARVFDLFFLSGICIIGVDIVV